MERPFPAKISPRTNPADEKPKVSMKDRLGTDPTTNIQQHIRNQRPSRNEKGDGPPPDPGYKYVLKRETFVEGFLKRFESFCILRHYFESNLSNYFFQFFG